MWMYVVHCAGVVTAVFGLAEARGEDSPGVLQDAPRRVAPAARA